MSAWQLDQFTDKDVVFVGAGKGRAMAGIQDFLEQHAGLRSFCGVDKQTGAEPLAFLCDYDPVRTIFIKNEGIPGSELPVPYLTPLQLFFTLVAQTGARTIGITGTKGKSTTTALTAHILETAELPVMLAGNIGVSPFAALDSATDQTSFVLELSSYQLSDLAVSPHISACVNLYHDHVDWHGSQDKYWEAKRNIMRFATAEDVFIYNPDFPTLQAWAAAATCRTVAIDPEQAVDLSRSQLYGDHNRRNALVAAAIAREYGVSDEIIQAAIDSFTPLEHRMQLVAEKGGRWYVDDAIGMTPESTSASLQAISQKFGAIGCLLLGGQDRDYDFTLLLRQVADLAIPCLVLFPDTTAKLKAALPDGYQPLILESSDMTEAVRWGAAHAPEHSVVLLSTAAPSYSLWNDFEDKGQQFQAAVASL